MPRVFIPKATITTTTCVGATKVFRFSNCIFLTPMMKPLSLQKIVRSTKHVSLLELLFLDFKELMGPCRREWLWKKGNHVRHIWVYLSSTNAQMIFQVPKKGTTIITEPTLDLILLMVYHGAKVYAILCLFATHWMVLHQPFCSELCLWLIGKKR